jgi:hypothetical protein|tara:strand:- start:640 stop:810 length:171 start_codon:yes stop_codon:yes gene_type:complete
MKVKIEMTIDIDKEVWMLEYGLGPDEVREDVKFYCNNLVNGWLMNLGLMRQERGRE